MGCIVVFDAGLCSTQGGRLATLGIVGLFRVYASSSFSEISRLVIPYCCGSETYNREKSEIKPENTKRNKKLKIAWTT